MKFIQISFRVIFLVSLVIISILAIQEIDLQSSSVISDKFLHFSCFFYLALVGWLARILHKELSLYVIVLAYGILIEIVQIYIPYRSFEFLDIFADLTGIIAATFLINLLKDLYPDY